MKVSFEPDPAGAQFQDIVVDGDFVAIIDLAAGSRLARIVVSSLIAQVRKRSGQPGGLAKMIAFFGRAHPSSPSEVEELTQQIEPRFTSLYLRHEPDHIRGAFVEQLVLRRLSDRYGNNRLADNVFVVLENESSYRTSRSVDVAGWDEARGECHDCKSRARSFRVGFVNELEDNLPTSAFKIGLVSADSDRIMSIELRKLGYSPSPQTTLVALESLWEIAPLQD